MAVFNLFSNPNRRRRPDVAPCATPRDLGEDPSRPSPKAIVYQSELDFISRCILDYPDIETGGELFGFWTQTGTPVVMYAVGPGPRARHHSTAFLQDPDYVDIIEVELCNLTGLQHIGQWHSHHQLSLAHPSGGDVASMQRGVGQPGFPRMLLCIGNCTPSRTTVNAFNFHENCPGHYVHALWDVIPLESPFRPVIDRMFTGRLYQPRTRFAAHGDDMNQQIRGASVSAPAPDRSRLRQHWMTERIENVEMMKRFVRAAAEICAGSNPTPEIMDSGEPLFSLYDGVFKIILPYGFPERSPLYQVIDSTERGEDDPFNEDAVRVWEANRLLDLDQRFEAWLGFTWRLIQAETTPPPVPSDDSGTPADNQSETNDNNNITTDQPTDNENGPAEI
ncbi:MAG: hypothetical protein NC336_07240 [Clostridium sp.]|nr:hypothetical protein [Clostridium sp.]